MRESGYAIKSAVLWPLTPYEEGSADAQLHRMLSARCVFPRQWGGSMPFPSVAVQFVPVLCTYPQVFGDGTCEVEACTVRVDNLFQNLYPGILSASDVPFPTTFPSLLLVPLGSCISKEQYITEHGCPEIQNVVCKGAEGLLGVWELKLIV